MSVLAATVALSCALLALTAARASAAGTLVAAYSFDDGSGSTLTDASGNGKNGTIVNPSWTTGKFGSALSFNGTNARVDLPALGTFYKTGFTYEAWVKKSGTKLDDGIVGTWDYPAGGPMLWVDHLVGRYYLTMNVGMENYLDSGTTPTPGTWQHIAATYDGTTARFYVNGVQVASRTFTGNVGDSNSWHIGAYGSNPGQYFDGLIDEVRIYNGALSATDIQNDMNTPVVSDTSPPTAPTNFAKTGATASTISTSWTASTDNRGVAGYDLFRGGTLIDSVTTTSYTFTGLTCGNSYNLSVRAFDAANNTSAQTPLTASTAACDTTPPTVSITAPANGATVTGQISVNANASDNDTVAGVQFKLDGANLGSEDTSSPYSVTWNTATASSGSHTLTAVARDASGNTATSSPITVTVPAAPANPTPVAAYSFDDGAGTVAGDATGHGNQGTINGATWTASGKFGSALSFDGSSSRVDLPALGRFYKTGFTLEAWIKSDGKLDDGIVGSWNNADNGGPMLWIDHIAGHYYLAFGTGLSTYLDSGQTVTAGQWHHIAGTYDGATARVYVDGTLVASKAFTGNIGDANVWRIGAYGATPGGFFDGLIDEVRIYDKPLSASQIGVDMNTPVTSSLAVLSTSPKSGDTNEGAGTTVTATLNQALSAASVTTSTFLLRDASSNLVPATVSYDATSGKISLDPTGALNYGATYTATVKSGSTGVKSAGGGTLSADKTWSFTVEPRQPILLITASAQPFSSYTSEILKAEGLDEYSSLDISLLSPSVLSGFDEVVLGDVPVSNGQANMLSNWVNGGGKLVALHPDKDLASLLGLTDLGATLSNAYLKVDTTSGTPGAGIVGQTIQYHGTADRYLANSGTTTVATLYSNASTATFSPAVTIRSVGVNGGQAAAFTYDLSRSVVYTRQGNPAWAGQDRDGVFPARTNDLFFGAKTGDVQPDWVDLSKVAIPQADEQQRLLANVLTSMAKSRKPLPRFWYLPHGYKAAVVMTGDDHAVGGTAGRFDQYKADSPAGCSVADWECVRSTSYVYPASPLTDAQAKSYEDQGFEVALHVSPVGINQLNCANWTPSGLDDIFDVQLAAFDQAYPSVHSPQSQRMHCVSWDDWATQAKVEAAKGIRLDTNYYYYPSTWMATKPGFMTGSGLIMPFADTDGSRINTYQAATEITDESGQAEPSTINSLLDNAVGSNGYYGAFVMNIHTDNAVSSDSDAIVASAQARDVPIVSAKQMLDWVDGRNASSFSSFGWSGGNLTFTVSADTEANGLQGMLPTSSSAGTLQTVTRGGNSVSLTTKTIKGVSYAFFDAASGSYTAHYG